MSPPLSASLWPCLHLCLTLSLSLAVSLRLCLSGVLASSLPRRMLTRSLIFQHVLSSRKSHKVAYIMFLSALNNVLELVSAALPSNVFVTRVLLRNNMLYTTCPPLRVHLCARPGSSPKSEGRPRQLGPPEDLSREGARRGFGPLSRAPGLQAPH